MNAKAEAAAAGYPLLRSSFFMARVRKMNGASAEANPTQYTNTAVESRGLSLPKFRPSKTKKITVKM